MLMKTEMKVMATHIFVLDLGAPSGWHHITQLCRSDT
jgi:hypothetical protein